MAGEDVGAARARAARRPAARHPAGVAADRVRQHGRHALRRARRRASSDAGVRLTDEPMPLFDEMLAVNAKGGIAPAEAFAIHRENLAQPRRRLRSERARAHRARRETSRPPTMSRWRGSARGWSARWMRSSPHLDALVLPTTPIVAPTIAEMEDTRHLQHQEHAAAAQYLDLEFLRHVRDLASDSGRGPAGRADAGRAQRPRPAAVRDRGRRSSGTSPRDARVRQNML